MWPEGGRLFKLPNTTFSAGILKMQQVILLLIKAGQSPVYSMAAQNFYTGKASSVIFFVEIALITRPPELPAVHSFARTILMHANIDAWHGMPYFDR